MLVALPLLAQNPQAIQFKRGLKADSVFSLNGSSIWFGIEQGRNVLRLWDDSTAIYTGNVRRFAVVPLGLELIGNATTSGTLTVNGAYLYAGGASSNTIISESYNGIVSPQAGLANTVAGLFMTNSTAATVGTANNSPAIQLRQFSWNTGAAQSEENSWYIHNWGFVTAGTAGGVLAFTNKRPNNPSTYTPFVIDEIGRTLIGYTKSQGSDYYGFAGEDFGDHSVILAGNTVIGWPENSITSTLLVSGAATFSDSLTVTESLNALANLDVAGLIRVDTIYNTLGVLIVKNSLGVDGLIRVDTVFNPLGALVVNDSLTVTGLAFVSSAKIGTNGVVIDSVKNPITGSNFLAVYSGGVPFYAKNDSASGGTGTDPTKIAIRDTLNAASPAITILTSQFSFRNAANDFLADTVAAERVRATSYLEVGNGTTASLGEVTFVGANVVTDSWGNLAIRTSNTTAINKGAQISLGGVYSGFAPFYTYFGTIAGRKENSTASNTAGFLSFATQSAGGTTTEWLRIGSDGVLTATGLATLDANAGTATIGAGDSVQVTVTGVTSASGVAFATYKTTTPVVADTIASYTINTDNKITLFGKFGWSVGWGILKK